jgi:hypothetical protein
LLPRVEELLVRERRRLAELDLAIDQVGPWPGLNAMRRGSRHEIAVLVTEVEMIVTKSKVKRTVQEGEWSARSVMERAKVREAEVRRVWSAGLAARKTMSKLRIRLLGLEFSESTEREREELQQRLDDATKDRDKYDELAAFRQMASRASAAEREEAGAGVQVDWASFDALLGLAPWEHGAGGPVEPENAEAMLKLFDDVEVGAGPGIDAGFEYGEGAQPMEWTGWAEGEGFLGDDEPNFPFADFAEDTALDYGLPSEDPGPSTTNGPDDEMIDPALLEADPQTMQWLLDAINSDDSPAG